MFLYAITQNSKKGFQFQLEKYMLMILFFHLISHTLLDLQKVAWRGCRGNCTHISYPLPANRSPNPQTQAHSWRAVPQHKDARDSDTCQKVLKCNTPKQIPIILREMSPRSTSLNAWVSPTCLGDRTMTHKYEHTAHTCMRLHSKWVFNDPIALLSPYDKDLVERMVVCLMSTHTHFSF